MAAKNKTLESQYRGIVAAYGYRWEDVQVLSYSFKDESKPELFYYGILRAGIPHISFDCSVRRANIIVEAGQDIAGIAEIAAHYGGTRQQPNLR